MQTKFYFGGIKLINNPPPAPRFVFCDNGTKKHPKIYGFSSAEAAARAFDVLTIKRAVEKGRVGAASGQVRARVSVGGRRAGCPARPLACSTLLLRRRERRPAPTPPLASPAGAGHQPPLC